jgi:DNA topoisomerase VI subunit B
VTHPQGRKEVGEAVLVATVVEAAVHEVGRRLHEVGRRLHERERAARKAQKKARKRDA